VKAMLRVPPVVLFVALTCVAAVACGGGGSGPTSTPAPVLQKASSNSGDGQVALVGTALANPLRVLVTLSGVPQSGATVTWLASGAGAAVAPSSAVTDATGIATTTWTLGSTVGSQSATATLPGATGSPVTFAATATAAPVPAIQKATTASGDAQTGTVATALANPLRVLITLSGAPQAGDTVVWAAVGAGSSVAPLRSVTDATGIATTTWTLGQLAGTQSASATFAGASGSPVAFSATATAGAASQLVLAGGDNQTGSLNAALPVQLSVRTSDVFGNATAGTAVTWAVTGGAASVAPTGAVSDASGVARTTATLGATAGAVTITATNAALTGSPVTFHVTASSLRTAAGVQVGDDFFKSSVNGSQNPAVDTVAAGGTVTWTWVGAASHSVQSTGSPSFTNSTTKASGTYAVTFATAGTYTYICGVHGAVMSGTVVVR
jgi:plastocyanin